MFSLRAFGACCALATLPLLLGAAASDGAASGRPRKQGGRRRRSNPDRLDSMRLPPGPHGLPQELIDEHRRERALNAVLHVAENYGYAGCTVRRICRYAGISSTAFYQLFDNREDAFLAMYDRAADALLTCTETAWQPREGDDDPPDRIAQWHRCLETLLNAIADNPDIARVCIVRAMSVGEDMVAHHERALARFAAALERAIGEHTGEPPRPHLTKALAGMVHEMIQERVVNDQIATIPDLLDDLFSFSLMLFKVAPHDLPASESSGPGEGSRVDPAALSDYQDSLDRVYQQSRELMSQAPSWQAALYQALRACYTEMSSHPTSLQLHFVTTFHDPAVQELRTAHRVRLLTLLEEARADAPARAQSDMLLSTIHKLIREQVVKGQEPPDLDTAEHTIATLLFEFHSPQAAEAEPNQGTQGGG